MEPVTDPAKLAAYIADIIRTDRQRWEQAHYFGLTWFDEDFWVPSFYASEAREKLLNGTCGSTACVAGWACILAAPGNSRITITYDVHVKTSEHERGIDVHEFARSALNLTVSQADWLFHSLRSETEVLWALDNIAAGKPWHPHWSG